MPSSSPTPAFQKDLLPGTWKNLFYPPERDQYTYFAHREQHPFTAPAAPDAPFHPAKAAWAADAAMLAYGRFGQNLIPISEFYSLLESSGFEQHDLIGNWELGGKGTQGFFAANEQFAILSFRGTERDDFSDLICDLKPLMVGEPPAQGGTGTIRWVGRVATFLKGLLSLGCVVHKGFQRALDQVWPETERLLTDYRRSHPNAEICFTGHSLGAALATLAVSRFSGGTASLYTIGSPRVGNRVFCDRVRQHATLGVHRFANGDDLVTHVPIQARFYSHIEALAHHIGPGDAITASQSGASADFAVLRELLKEFPKHCNLLNLADEPPAPLVDHSPARYCMQIRNWLLAQPTAIGQGA
jgi:hypothetical protein